MKSVPLGRRVSAVVALLVPVAVLVELVAVLLRRPLILAAAAVAVVLIAWAHSSGKLPAFFDHIIDNVIGNADAA